jgi:phosphonopyruvate decarboxylase
VDVKELIESIGAEFYTGVPDSQLKALCNYLMNTYGIDPQHHVIAANEGNCTALAAGYHLATGKVPVVYMQNSGIGNSINPVASLLNDRVYAIPCIFMVGWRGEPGEHDEPQHIFQGEVTIRLLEDMGITVYVLDKTTTQADIKAQMVRFRPLLDQGKSVAFVVRKNALQYGEKVDYHNDFAMRREEIIEHIARIAQRDIIVSTTGKASRELFEIREREGESHQYDFLTVGSMGHSSSIALGIALNKPNTKIWCIDGDGAALMHMGAMAVIGANKPENLVHIVINNEAHETVGGMPTVGGHMDLVKIAEGCGYLHALCVEDLQSLDTALAEAKKASELTFIEVKAAIGARSDLGRPTTTARENKESFMKYLKS